MSRTQWTSRVVTDTLDDESAARVVLEDWLHDYYEIDEDEGWIAAEYLYAAAHEEN